MILITFVYILTAYSDDRLALALNQDDLCDSLGCLRAVNGKDGACWHAGESDYTPINKLMKSNQKLKEANILMQKNISIKWTFSSCSPAAASPKIKRTTSSVVPCPAWSSQVRGVLSRAITHQTGLF